MPSSLRVSTILANVGEERESLYFERKATVNGNALAKACAAFANTMGGLLVVGVADDDDTLVGVPPLASEAQLWVKDTPGQACREAHTGFEPVPPP